MEVRDMSGGDKRSSDEEEVRVEDVMIRPFEVSFEMATEISFNNCSRFWNENFLFSLKRITWLFIVSMIAVIFGTSVSGVSSTDILLRDMESSLESVVDETACEP